MVAECFGKDDTSAMGVYTKCCGYTKGYAKFYRRG